MTTDTDCANLLERLAREAGIRPATAGSIFGPTNIAPTGSLERFAALVAEECAKVCESMGDGPFARGWDCEEYAKTIRARFGLAASKEG